MKTTKSMMKKHNDRNMVLDSLKEVNLPPVKETRTITTRNGKSVVTDMTDAEAVTELEKLFDAGKVSGGFPQSLIKNQHRLSDEQTKWVHVLVVQAKMPRSAKANAIRKIDPARLVKLFEAAAKGLKFPVISLSTEDKVDVTVYRATEKSKYPGSFQITNGRGWKKAWFGRILPSGEVTLRDTVPQTVIKLVTALAADPQGTMVKSGHLSGRCSCCNKQLDDPKSVKLGIGPVCAKKWSLAIR